MTNELGVEEIDDARRDQHPNPIPRFTSMKLSPKARCLCSGGTSATSSVHIGPQPAPPKAPSAARRRSPGPRCGRGPKTTARGVGDEGKQDDAKGPNRSVSVPQKGRCRYQRGRRARAAASQNRSRSLARCAGRRRRVRGESVADAADERAGIEPAQRSTDRGTKVDRNEGFEKLHRSHQSTRGLSQLTCAVESQEWNCHIARSIRLTA